MLEIVDDIFFYQYAYLSLCTLPDVQYEENPRIVVTILNAGNIVR